MLKLVFDQWREVRFSLNYYEFQKGRFWQIAILQCAVRKFCPRVIQLAESNCLSLINFMPVNGLLHFWFNNKY